MSYKIGLNVRYNQEQRAAAPRPGSPTNRPVECVRCHSRKGTFVRTDEGYAHVDCKRAGMESNKERRLRLKGY